MPSGCFDNKVHILTCRKTWAYAYNDRGIADSGSAISLADGCINKYSRFQTGQDFRERFNKDRNPC